MVNVSIVLDFLFFVFLAGKWRHKMELKFWFIIFLHLFGSDGRGPLPNIKGKTIIKISYFNQKIQLLQCQNLLLKIEFMQISLYYISGLNQDIE